MSSKNAGVARTAAVTASIGLASAGAAASASTMCRSSCSDPANSTSRLSAKCRKKVRAVTPARSAISATVVPSYPRSAYSAIAASRSRPAASGSHRPMRSILADVIE